MKHSKDVKIPRKLMLDITAAQLTSVQMRILAVYFCYHHEHFTYRQLARFIGATPGAICRAMPYLVRCGFLTTVGYGRGERRLIELNTEY